MKNDDDKKTSQAKKRTAAAKKNERTKTVPPSENTSQSAVINDTIVPFSGKKRRRKADKIRMENVCVERYSPSAQTGLTQQQVQEHTEQGAVNFTRYSSGKTYGSIFVNNIFTFFNMLTFAVFIAMLAVIKEPKELSKLFFMIIVLMNVAIGIIQEIKSKRATDRLKLITAPTALVIRDGKKLTVPTEEVVLDDVIIFDTGKQICTDSIVLEGEAEVNESLLTGESEPVVKKAGMPLFSGSFVVSGACVARVDKVGADNYVEKLSSYARQYKKPKSEMRASVTAVIKAVTCFIIPIAVILLLIGVRNLSGNVNGNTIGDVVSRVGGAIIGMIPSGMFLLASVALFQSVIRLSKRKIVVKDLYCIEMLARVNVLCLDKTGTITDGTMRVVEVSENPASRVTVPVDVIVGSLLTATGDNNMTAVALADKFGYNRELKAVAAVPFSSQKKVSAATFEGKGTFILGAPEFVMKTLPEKISAEMHGYAKRGMRVLMLAHSASPIRDRSVPDDGKPVCLIAIEDHIRPEAPEIIDWFKQNGVQVKIISGDNPLTVSEVASRVGVENADKYISLDGFSAQQVEEAASRYTVFGRVSPEQKCVLIQALKRRGNNVAMTGDGVNDILAMHEADCAIAMGSGSDAAKNVCHLLLTDSSFAALPLVVKEGRRVVNNVQSSSALYLMKTFMSIVLSLISVVLALARVSDDIYFFDTSNLLALEFFIIGLPSIMLATQSNDNLIKGQFLGNVFRKAVPCGIGLVFTVMLVYLVHRSGVLGLTSVEYTTLLVAGTLFTGFFALIRICAPLNSFKTALCVADFIMCLIAMTGLIWLTDFMHLDLFGDILPLTDLSFPRMTFLVSAVSLSYFAIVLCDMLLSLTEKTKLPHMFTLPESGGDDKGASSD